jgi:hypothetical protein
MRVEKQNSIGEIPRYVVISQRELPMESVK